MVLNFNTPFLRTFFNSLGVGLAYTALALLLCSVAGFVFAKYRFPGRRVLFLTVLFTMMIPPAVTLIPLFYIMRDVGWIDTYQALVIPLAANAFGVFWMRQYLQSLPSELLDPFGPGPHRRVQRFGSLLAYRFTFKQARAGRAGSYLIYYFLERLFVAPGRVAGRGALHHARFLIGGRGRGGASQPSDDGGLGGGDVAHYRYLSNFPQTKLIDGFTPGALKWARVCEKILGDVRRYWGRRYGEELEPLPKRHAQTETTRRVQASNLEFCENEKEHVCQM